MYTLYMNIYILLEDPQPMSHNTICILTVGK